MYSQYSGDENTGGILVKERRLGCKKRIKGAGKRGLIQGEGYRGGERIQEEKDKIVYRELQTRGRIQRD